MKRRKLGSIAAAIAAVLIVAAALSNDATQRIHAEPILSGLQNIYDHAVTVLGIAQDADSAPREEGGTAAEEVGGADTKAAGETKPPEGEKDEESTSPVLHCTDPTETTEFTETREPVSETAPAREQTTNETKAAQSTAAATTAAPKQTKSAPAASAPPQTTAAADVKPQEQTLSELEQKMVTLVNAERKKAGLNALKAHTKLTETARAKSKDMIDNHYFSHTSPTYGSPFDMMHAFGITYKVSAGENIAMNMSVESAHEALMGSKGHAENILNDTFTEIGIGIVRDSRGYYYITQMFIGN